MNVLLDTSHPSGNGMGVGYFIWFGDGPSPVTTRQKSMLPPVPRDPTNVTTLTLKVGRISNPLHEKGWEEPKNQTFLLSLSNFLIQFNFPFFWK